MQSFIGAESTWVLWAVMVSIAAISIWMEQKYQWANRVTGCIIALAAMMLLSNLRVIPTEAPAYDQVWTFVVPLAIPMLLFQCDLRKIFRESGRLLIIFLISSIGTVIGILTSYCLFRGKIPFVEQIAAIFTGSYVGGSVNFVALADSFHVPSKVVSAAVIADNLLMALYFVVLTMLPAIPLFQKHYRHNTVMENRFAKSGTSALDFWKKKEVGLRDIAFTFAAALVIVAVSTELSNFLNANMFSEQPALQLLQQFFGNKYLLITTITICFSTIFPKQLGAIPCANEIGVFLIYIFFTVIGAPASITNILTNSPLLLAFAFVAVFVNMVFTLIFGKMFRFSLEEIILASNANIGGPTTAAAMAISKGWSSLVAPIMLIGTLGYILGNYYGLMIGIFLIR